MSTSATEGTQGQESGTPNGSTAEGQESAGGAAGQGQESGQQGTSTDGQFSLDSITDPAVRAYVEAQQRQATEARNEAARYRTERNQFQTQITEAQRAAETDQQRIEREATERQERLEALERENRTLKVGSAIRTAATSVKAFNPELVASMLEPKVVLDDKGQPTNLTDLLTALRQSDPYLFKRADNNGGEGQGGSAPAGGMNDIIRGQIASRRGTA